MIDFRTPTADQIAIAQGEVIAQADALVDAVLAVPAGQRTAANTLLPLEAIGDTFGQAYGRYGFMARVAVAADVREAADELRRGIEHYQVALSFREEVHDAVAAFAASDEARSLTGETARLLERVLRDYRRNGFNLPAEQRRRLQVLRTRMVELGIEFPRTIDSWDDGITVNEEQLSGLPPNYIDGLQRVDEGGRVRYRVSLDYPEFFPFMDNAESEDLRRELFEKSYRKGGPENVRVLEEAIAVRDEIARLTGYPSWAAYVLETRMAKTPDQVNHFLADLRERVAPFLARDLEDLRAAKRAHTGDPHAEVQLWDWRFYHNSIRRERYAVDEFEVARYFPMDAVLDGMFDVYQTLFDIRFHPVEPANAWHPDVRQFTIHNAADGAEIATFFLDLFPREHKFGHAAAFTLRSGRRLADGSYQQPVSAMVANFTKPAADNPSLLRHSEVETLFHEFGHILHQTLTKADLPRFAGSATERDFVEAPSQMLEHWVWDAGVLARFSRHVESGDPLPAHLLDALLRAKRLHAGVITARQLYFGTLDMAYHDAGAPKDTTAIARELHPISGFPMPEGTHWQSGWGHLFGYDAGYYGYMWSRVFADDMFTRFEEAGVMNTTIGMEYRTAILERGGAVDGDVLVHSFLGREPNLDAFLRELGLTE